MSEIERKSDGASFRDPSGFVFEHEGCLYRQVNCSYRAHYEKLMQSGLYASLVRSGMLVPHEETSTEPADGGFLVLKPEPVPFISYPSEWCFSALKDAALLTLDLQKQALDYNLTLKDASAFNIQFRGTQPLLLDTLSFEQYVEGEPWAAYRQFVEHFLLPLALGSYRDPRSLAFLSCWTDGMPLDLGAHLLPWRSRMRPGLFLHLHLHSRLQKRTSSASAYLQKSRALTKFRFYALLDSLRSSVCGLRLSEQRSTWGEYYDETSYSPAAMAVKEQAVQGMLAGCSPKSVWDLGANVGRFSRVAAEAGAYTVSIDGEHDCIERCYRSFAGGKSLLPLVMNLANPTPAFGFAHEERKSLLARGPADLVLCLALLHHLCIGGNVPFKLAASFLARAGRKAIVEFVPKSDKQVQRMLSARKDIFTGYTRESFEQAVRAEFEVLETVPLPECERVLYFLKTRRTVDD